MGSYFSGDRIFAEDHIHMDIATWNRNRSTAFEKPIMGGGGGGEDYWITGSNPSP